jgi:hypothetical protein
LFGALVLCVGVAQALGACGGDDGRPDNLVGTDGGSGGDDGGADSDAGPGGAGFGGFGGKKDGGDSGGAETGTGGSPVGAPVVTVTSPAAATDPSTDDVVIDNEIDALCTAVASTVTGAQPVDPASVKLALLDATSTVIDEFPGQPTSNPNEYTASFVLTAVASGPFSVRCSAGDTSTPAKIGTDTLQTFVDHGPDIDVTTPAPNSAYPLTGSVPFAFTVAPALLAATDPEADVTAVTLSTNGVSIPATPDPGVTNGYKLAVNFADTTLFPQPPNGSVPVVITGTNSRTPTAVVNTYSYSFVVDGAGPVIVIKSPKNQDIIGGQVTLSFSVVDTGSGVDKNTVAVELNNSGKVSYSPSVQWTNNNDDYTFTFDSANVQGSKVQVTVNVTASDAVGNDSAGASLVLYLDNVGPIVDLDSENVRTRKKVGAAQLCSQSFDPLGTLAADDLELVTPFKHFRALVWDQTNSVAGQTVFYHATTDKTSVFLYLQPDGPTIPLLLNNDGDPECDAINTVVNGQPIPNLDLNPVNPAGTAWYTNTDPTDPPPIAGTVPQCTMGTENPPNKLCTNASDLSVVIKHTMSGVEPVVYGIGAMTGLECTGTGWELSAQLANATQKEGWFCLAAIAKDMVGNTTVSAPLRVCYDDPATPAQPACAISSTVPPTCTDGCTPTPGFSSTIFPAP